MLVLALMTATSAHRRATVEVSISPHRYFMLSVHGHCSHNSPDKPIGLDDGEDHGEAHAAASNHDRSLTDTPTVSYSGSHSSLCLIPINSIADGQAANSAPHGVNGSQDVDNRNVNCDIFDIEERERPLYVEGTTRPRHTAKSGRRNPPIIAPVKKPRHPLATFMTSLLSTRRSLQDSDETATSEIK